MYRHSRKDNHKPFYIGIGSKHPKWIMGWRTEYQRAYSKAGFRSKHWHNVVNKYGYYVEILFESDDMKIIKQKEIEFISLYGRMDNKTGILVNKTSGGDGRMNTTHESMKNVIAYLKSKTNENHPFSRKVYKYSIDGKFIAEFPCILRAAESVGVTSGGAISSCCKQKPAHHTYKGYRWFYDYRGEKIDSMLSDLYANDQYNRSEQRNKRVAKICTTTGETLETYKSAKEASKQTGIKHRKITRIARGEGKPSDGYNWRYI